MPPSIAGRISTSHLSPKLSKRVARSFTSFDAEKSCVFSSVEIPSIPDPSNLVSEAGPQTQYWYVLQDTSANGTTCPVLGFTKVTDGALASHLISSNAVGYTKAALGISWKVKAPTVNVDSVSITVPRSKLFFDQPDAGNGGKTRLQNVWNQLPSDTNPDFAGMDQKISTIKSQAFQAVGMAITNSDDIASTFKSTNLRIYQALLDIDAVIGTANTTTASLIKPDWASTYRTYLANLLTTCSSAINSEVFSYLNNDLGPAVRSDNITLPDGTVSTTENNIGNGVDALLRAYSMPDSFTFDQEKLLGFPGVGLDEEGLREVLEFMRKEGRVEWVGNGKPSDGGADVCWVWWRKPEEWARVIEEWVESTGQKGSVLTLYELVEGEGGRGADFHGLDAEILHKALAILVKRGKAQVFGQEDQQGV
ncbi:hypothetical protein DID88_003899 [Monilinia fructigena]|uniref:ESCRT-II complex subunit VPS25 n=1 Tax=Monilinia fructigena TaxID=38457 RepID=A0A395IYS0_9HELO|nr:hypothetical protein DID88_003899 [Monilinia fructigena]